MSVMRKVLQAGLFGATLMAVAPVFAGGKTEDPARVIPGGSPALAPAATLGPGSVLIDFETLAVGDTLSNQYAAWGVTFSSSPYTGTDSPNGGWATNTDMTIVAVGGGDTGGLGSPTLVSGKILHSFNGWLNEDGDGSFLMSFSSPISAISVDFAGIATPSSTGLDIYNTAGAYVTSVFAPGTGQRTLTYVGTDIGFVVVTAGDYNDWVGVDNISFQVAAAVPEPESYGLLALGLGVLAIAARRRRH